MSAPPRRLPVIEPSAPDLALPARIDGPSAPPWEHAPTVEWQICGQCNYACSYCVQSPKYRVGYPSPELLDRALAALATLPGRWEVKMTGGEPFSSRLFLDHIVPVLLDTPHAISVLTNLSAPERQLVRFAELTRGRLAVVSASLHLESTDVDGFLGRLRALQGAVDPAARIVVNSVLVPDRLAEVRAAKAAVEAAGFRFFPQLMKVKRGLYPYSEAELAEVRAIVGDLSVAARLRSANLAPSYAGRACYTGARYFVLLQDGEAWSCRSARRYGEGRLGSVADGTFALAEGPVRCRYPICPCAVPANRGMIEGVPMRPSLAADGGEP